MTIKKILQTNIVIGSTVQLVYFDEKGREASTVVSFQGFNPRGQNNVAVFYEKDKKGIFGERLTIAPASIVSITLVSYA